MPNASGNPGIKALRRILLAKEVTPGTEVVPATALWRGTGVFEDLRTVTFPPEDIGVLSGLDRSYIAKVEAKLSMDATPATFEQLPYILAAGVKNVTTGVADGGGSGKVYAYPFPLTAADKASRVLQMFSLQGGDDNETEFAAHGFVEKFVLEAKAAEAWMVQADWQARQINTRQITATTISFDNAHHILDSASGLGGFKTGDKVTVSGTGSNNGTFTVTTVAVGQLTVTETTSTEAAGASVSVVASFSAPAVPTIEEILFGGSRLYIDPVGGTIGMTQKSLVMLGAKLECTKTGWIPVYTGDYIYFSFSKLTPPELVLQVTFEHDGTASAEKAAWRAQTPRLIRLVSEGSALTTAGTYSKKTLQIDLGGKWEKFDKLGDSNGNDMVVGTMRVRPNATSGTFATITVVNNLASLP